VLDSAGFTIREYLRFGSPRLQIAPDVTAIMAAFASAWTASDVTGNLAFSARSHASGFEASSVVTNVEIGSSRAFSSLMG
jgi:hypothetical protein